MNWYCIHTKPRREHQVIAYLNDRLGVETYFPRLKRHKTIRRVRRQVVSPLFPRYLFVRFDTSSHYRSIRYAPEVIDVVSVRTEPTIVNDSLIEELKHWAGSDGDLLILPTDLISGNKVVITDGPLRGLPAVIMNIKNDSDRVEVLLSILTHGAKMLIDRSQLARIE